MKTITLPTAGLTEDQFDHVDAKVEAMLAGIPDELDFDARMAAIGKAANLAIFDGDMPLTMILIGGMFTARMEVPDDGSISLGRLAAATEIMDLITSFRAEYDGETIGKITAEVTL